MTPSVSKIAVISNHDLGWLDSLDTHTYQIDRVVLANHDFTFINEKHYDLLLITSDNPQLEIDEVIQEISRSQLLVSIIVLTGNNDPEHNLKLIELGADDVFDINENDEHLIRRLNIAIKYNYSRQISMRQSRDLNSVTVVSRLLHNANDPNNLITDALDIVSSTFNLMGLAIVLENGSQFHLRAGSSSLSPNRQIYDVMVQLHPYDPLRLSLEKGLVIVFEDLSINQYMMPIPIFNTLHSAIVVPLRYVNITLGAMMVFGKESNPLTRDDIVIYEHLATHLGSAYQNVRHSYTQDVSAKTSRYLLRTWQRLSTVYTSEEVNQTILTLASEISGVKHTLAWLYSDSREQPIINASSFETNRVFRHLYSQGIIDDYMNQFDTQLRPMIIWLGRSNTRNIGELFQAMEGQQLILIPIQDEARLLGCLLVSSNSNEEMNPEYISLLEGITHAAGQTLERNMLMSYQDQQRERLEAITRSIKDGVFFVNERQDVVFCNPQFTELTGISLSKVINMPVQILLDNLVNQSDNLEHTRQQLNLAIQQLKDDSLDQDYPIVEINIPAIRSRLYVEFTSLTIESDRNEQSWIGILRTRDRMVKAESELSSGILNSIIQHIQGSARDIYSDLVSFNHHDLNKSQTNAIQQIKQHSQEIEQLLINVQNLMELSQDDALKLTRNDPKKLLSVILNKPPLLQHDSRIEIRTSLKDSHIQVDRIYMMQAMTNLTEVALLLSDDTVQIQMGAQANQFIFRLVTTGRTIPVERFERILVSPNEDDGGIPYTAQLRLYFINQVIKKHEGQLLIKKATSKGMQFNIVMPIDNPSDDMMDIDQKQGRVPDRKLSSIMIYDTQSHLDDIDYNFLRTQDYDILYCDQIEQIYDEVEMVRVDVIILTIRHNHDSIIPFVERLRQQRNITIPLMILSTYNAEDIRIRSLRAGVDAYIGLPISDAELLAHVENLFERAKLPERVHEPLMVGELNIDFAQRQVVLNGESIDLTRIEYELLSQLALKIGQTLTHTELLTEVWGPEYRDDKQYLWVNMSRLRRKLENTENRKRYIFTQPGIGYILKNN